MFPLPNSQWRKRGVEEATLGMEKRKTTARAGAICSGWPERILFLHTGVKMYNHHTTTYFVSPLRRKTRQQRPWSPESVPKKLDPPVPALLSLKSPKESNCVTIKWPFSLVSATHLDLFRAHDTFLADSFVQCDILRSSMFQSLPPLFGDPMARQFDAQHSAVYTDIHMS